MAREVTVDVRRDQGGAMTDVLISIKELEEMRRTIDQLRERYATDLEAWRENNRYHAAEIERLKEIIRARENEV